MGQSQNENQRERFSVLIHAAEPHCCKHVYNIPPPTPPHPTEIRWKFGGTPQGAVGAPPPKTNGTTHTHTHCICLDPILPLPVSPRHLLFEKEPRTSRRFVPKSGRDGFPSASIQNNPGQLKLVVLRTARKPVPRGFDWTKQSNPEASYLENRGPW